ncbi:shikimate dehydrogenase [Rhizobium sp. RU36D]|uniref:shikimate dehydrogenase n=1 Tax=Rhizobium sp. RU36D TaxID=1907415 RepID=UPI0009D7E248|nr:shikimate dehydrogenase [Rhizobium sp. RU36D]SMC49877.1 shikimate dehydrogenase [Rhizobium sp. RU36D]
MDHLTSLMRVGLIGSGIQRSLTPAMHMAEGAAHGYRYDYELLDLDVLGVGVEQLPQLLAEAEQRGFLGLNITHPCKQTVMPLLDELSDEAATLGAVNTVVLRNGRRIGHNTDWWGFAEGFRRQLPDADLSHVVQLGAGGAGAATAFAILKLGARALTIVDVDPARAQTLAMSMARHFPSASIVSAVTPDAALGAATGLVHATPTGMDKHPGLPLPAELLRPDLWVAEIVYFPLETALLAEARRRGCRVADGGGMAVYQAVGAFALFTGIEPDAERMRAHFQTLTEAARSRA